MKMNEQDYLDMVGADQREAKMFEPIIGDDVFYLIGTEEPTEDFWYDEDLAYELALDK
jgi:hypothetical protein